MPGDSPTLSKTAAKLNLGYPISVARSVRSVRLELHPERLTILPALVRLLPNIVYHRRKHPARRWFAGPHCGNEKCFLEPSFARQSLKTTGSKRETVQFIGSGLREFRETVRQFFACAQSLAATVRSCASCASSSANAGVGFAGRVCRETRSLVRR